MSNKKSLLTESEVRRFMSLANIPVVNKIHEMKDPREMAREANQPFSSNPAVAEQYPQEGQMAEMGYGSSMEEEDEMPPMDGGEEMAAGGEASEAEIMDVLQDFAAKVKEKFGIDLEVAGGEEGGEDVGGDMELDMEPSGDEEPSGEEEEEKEPAGEEGEEEEEEEEEETEGQQELQESKELVNTVLARVTARLMAEAKRTKAAAAEKKKKEEEAKKKKEAMKKKAAAAKKKLEEANAPAPKSSMSNASAAGVAKGHGPGKKAFGTSRTEGHEWKAGKNSKGDEMGAESASAEHIISHGKKNLATQGGNKSK